MSKLIGTNPNQVPSNADLGTAAFMDAKDFLTSRGSSLSAIDAVIPKTAVNVFIYDTSLDTDGGAWRKRTQHTSWYGETLNTTTRGSRKEFPAVAVFVVEQYNISIYDGDDVNLPLWMKFEQEGLISWASSGTILTYSAKAKNGVVVLGTWGGAHVCDFVKDDVLLGYSTYPHALTSGRTIADRNKATAWYNAGDGAILLSSNVYDVAVGVLSNAPIDTTTGLEKVTIAIATETGISVIKHDDTVIDITGTDNADIIRYIEFVGDKIVFYNQNHYSVSVFDIPDSDLAVPGSIHSGSEYRYSGHTVLTSGLRTIPTVGGVGSVDKGITVKDDDIILGGSKGVSQVNRYPSNPGMGMVNYITDSYNTGWIPGSAVLATLSDTVAGISPHTARVKNHVTNSTFDADASGWSLDSGEGGTLTWNSGGYAVVDRGTGDSTFAIAQNISSLTGGDIVYVNFSVYPNNTGRMRVRLGGSLEQWYSTTLTANTWQTVEFTARMEGGRIEIAANGGAGITQFFVDNVTIQKIEKDHSIKGTGLRSQGSVKKQHVNNGAELVSYSGFSSSSYFKVPRGQAFGSSDIYVACWAKFDSTNNTYSHIFSVNGQTDSNGLTFKKTRGGVSDSMYFFGNSTTLVSSNVNIPTDSWIFVSGGRQNGLWKIYLNGELLNTGVTNTFGVGGASGEFCKYTVGLNEDVTNEADPDVELSLLRVSESFPTDDQIKKMYEDEKHLFAPNAKCTLYGPSSTVNGIDYDEVSGLLHVGTSAGRSVFQGLRRVDNTTDAVGTAISAVNGMVVEE